MLKASKHINWYSNQILGVDPRTSVRIESCKKIDNKGFDFNYYHVEPALMSLLG